MPIGKERKKKLIMTLNYTTFTQLPINYEFVYLPSKYSRIPRFTERKTTATVGLKSVQAVPAYEVTENNYKYIICAYKDKLYWPLSFGMSSNYPFSGVSSPMLMCPDDRAGIARPYFEGEDNSKYEYNQTKSSILYGDHQVIATVKDWASKHMIAFNNQAYIELKSPLISVSFLTDSLNLGSFIYDDDTFANAYDFKLDQLDEFKSYINHYRANLIYKIDHNLGKVSMAKVDLETLDQQAKINKIVKLVPTKNSSAGFSY